MTSEQPMSLQWDGEDVDAALGLAAAIGRRYEGLSAEFDYDQVRLDSYLAEVLRFNARQLPRALNWAKADEDREVALFQGLIDGYPLEPEIFSDDQGIYRSYMARFCIEFVKARAAMKSGESEKSWWYLSCANFHYGQAQGYFFYARLDDAKKKSGSKGGRATQKNKEVIVRNACIEILLSERPSYGWRSMEVAVKDVLPKVKRKIGSLSEQVDVEVLLYDWLRDDRQFPIDCGFGESSVVK